MLIIPNMRLHLECWVGDKTKGKETILVFNPVCKDIKGIQEILIKTSTSFVTLGPVFLRLGPQFFSFINQGNGVFIY